jgi:hypothetical protein
VNYAEKHGNRAAEMHFGSGRKRKQPATRGDDFLWTAEVMTRA